MKYKRLLWINLFIATIGAQCLFYAVSPSLTVLSEVTAFHLLRNVFYDAWDQMVMFALLYAWTKGSGKTFERVFRIATTLFCLYLLAQAFITAMSLSQESALYHVELFHHTGLCVLTLLLFLVGGRRVSRRVALMVPVLLMAVALVGLTYMLLFSSYSYGIIPADTKLMMGTCLGILCAAMNSFLVNYHTYCSEKETNQNTAERKQQECLTELRDKGYLDAMTEVRTGTMMR